MRPKIDPDKEAKWVDGVAKISSKTVGGRQESVLDVYNEGDVSTDYHFDFTEADPYRSIPSSVTSSPRSAEDWAAPSTSSTALPRASFRGRSVTFNCLTDLFFLASSFSPSGSGDSLESRRKSTHHRPLPSPRVRRIPDSAPQRLLPVLSESDHEERLSLATTLGLSSKTLRSIFTS